MKAIQKMSKGELREACNHQHAALQSLLATCDVLKPELEREPDDVRRQHNIALLETSQESARRALDAYL